MRKQTLLPLAVAVLTMTACASGAQPTPQVKLLPPASLTAQCPAALPQPASGKTLDLLANHVQVAKLYWLCRERHLGLANWLESSND